MQYDILIVGGGIAGASLACSMSKAGARVLVLESETEFKDRVRGEVAMPWGAAEAKALGLTGTLLQAGAHQIRWCNNHMGAQPIARRDLPATTLPKEHVLTFYHPRAQTFLLTTAASAGATVRQGVTVSAIVPGSPPRLTQVVNGRSEELSARLIVVAEGRNAQLRRQCGFPVQRETHSLCIAGVLLESVALPDDSLYLFTNVERSELVVWAPQGARRVRAYLCYWLESRPRLQASADLQRFLGDMSWTGSVREYFSDARQAGPLATFQGADRWVDHPYREGVALLGDAAASNDPAWGQGLSLSFRGVRTLRDALLANKDWDAAGHEYARAQNRDYSRVRTVAGWFRELFLETGPAADARRARALPLTAEDPTRVPDLLFSGPDTPLDENTRRRFYGEDVSAASG